jgi:hypothetical protein
MQYLPGTRNICLTYNELVPKILTAENFRQLKSRSERNGQGIKVHPVNSVDKYIIEFGSLRTADKDKVIKQFGDPRVYVQTNPLRELVVVRDAARKFYAEEYRLPSGRMLPLTHQLKYARQCDWLGAIDKSLVNKKSTKEILNISIAQLWESWSKLVNNDDFVIFPDFNVEDDMPQHDLPTSVDRLKRRYQLYREKGMRGLVEEFRFDNDHRRVVTPKIEDLILSLYCKQGYSAYMNEVCKTYRKFITGEEVIVNVHPDHGGEVFDPMEFYVKGEPYVLGESTVDYYIKKPVNQAVINKLRLKGQDYGTMYRPSVKRIAAVYALSKITMDDIDLPFKGPDGDRVVKSYQVYDCASEAIIGVSFSEDKNKELIMEAMRDMFRNIIRHGWGMPWEIEMERHLTSAMKGKEDKVTGEWTDDIYTPGAVFPATRICQTAQSKRAEGFIKKKKYGYQRRREGFQGRFYAKLLTNRLNTDQKQLRQLYETIVVNELADIAAFNSELHPKQELYPGLTRWQVLEQHQNPQLAKYQPEQVIQFIGYSTATSIRAGVARVQYGDYQLPDIKLISNQKYNGEIVAYYLPDDDGQVQSVHLFEDGRYLCEAKRKAAFQEALIEQTADDVAIMQQQWGQQSAFDKIVKDGLARLTPVGVMAKDELPVAKKREVAKKVQAPKEQAYLPMADDMSARERAYNDI